MRLRLVLALPLLTGCSINDIPFRCAKDSECVKGGESGVCEPTGYCSFADSGCDSGRSYGDHAPSELVDTCIPKCVEQLALGGFHTCARLPDGHLECWGQAFDGQLGNGTTTLDHSSDPVEVDTEVSPASDVSAGDAHTCAVRAADGSVWCWGGDTSLQLGVLTLEPGPVQVSFGPAAPKAVKVAAGAAHTCARGGLGVVCWGFNKFGQLGLGYAADPPTHPLAQPPSGVVAFAPPLDIQEIAAGGGHTCAIPSLGSLRCWGNNQAAQIAALDPDKPVLGFEDPRFDTKVLASAVALGTAHTCVLEKGQVRCWGANGSLQCGNDSPVLSPKKDPVPLDADARSLCAGYAHTCAVLVDGRITCWGRNDFGQLGPSAPAKQSLPVTFSLPVPAAEVRCGAQHTCARTEAGRVYCWGNNDKGQLGNGTTSLDPEPEPDPTVTAALCAGL